MGLVIPTYWGGGQAGNLYVVARLFPLQRIGQEHRREE